MSPQAMVDSNEKVSIVGIDPRYCFVLLFFQCFSISTLQMSAKLSITACLTRLHFWATSIGQR